MLIVNIAILIFVIVLIRKAIQKVETHFDKKREEERKKKQEIEWAWARKTSMIYWENLPNVYNSERMKNLSLKGYQKSDLTRVVEIISIHFHEDERKPEILSYRQYALPAFNERVLYRREKILELQQMLGNPKWKYTLDGKKTNWYDYPLFPDLDLRYLLGEKYKTPYGFSRHYPWRR